MLDHETLTYNIKGEALSPGLTRENFEVPLHVLQGTGSEISFILGTPPIKCKGGAVKGAFRAANSMDNRRLAADLTDADRIYNSKRRK